MTTSLHDLLHEASQGRLAELLRNTDPARVLAAMSRAHANPQALALLLSPGADQVLEQIAQAARRLTLARFGRARQLYAPLYLSSRCTGSCPYCGFSAELDTERRHLSLEEVSMEAERLRRAGIQHILLVSGDDPRHADVDFIATAAARIRDSFPSVSVEIPTLPIEGYRALAKAGVDGVTLYQETYDRGLYERLHADGPKADFDDRLDALDRAGSAGFAKLTAGALLGLAPWRTEALRLGLHVLHLQRSWWKSFVAIGVPRLHHVPEQFVIPHPVDDRAFVHIIVSMRVCFEDLGIVVSTREQPQFRERLLALGATQLSAGSKTTPGGYSRPDARGAQFDVADDRSPETVAKALLAAGYDPVWKDWDQGLGPEVNRDICHNQR